MAWVRAPADGLDDSVMDGVESV